MRTLLLALLFVAGGWPGEGDRREAVRVYEEARALWETRTAEGLRSSLPLFEKAVALDPSLAEAHAGLADAECLLALYGLEGPADALPRAEAAAREAITLDPELAAHASLGLVRYLYHWSFDEAEESFRKSIALEPDRANVHHWYGMMLMATGRYDEALLQIEAARRLEPDSPLYATKRGTVLMAAGRLDEAERELRDVVSGVPTFTMAHRELGEIEIERGRLERALGLLERGAREEPTYFYVLGRLGREEDVRRRLAELEHLEAMRYVSPLDFALLHAGLGENDRALGEIERALAAKDPALVYLGSQPALAALRSEARFQKVLESMGLRGRR